MTYTPLHLHTHYSLMDGISDGEEYVKRAIENGMTALAITDHGTLSGHPEFYRACKANGIKPILGVEAYFASDRFNRDKDERAYYHLTILAKNQNGLRNLQHLMRIAWTEGYFYKPRIDWAVLDEFGDDLIVGTACMSGPVAKALETGNVLQAKNFISQFSERFGKNFFVEVMPHNSPELNKQLIQLADEHGVMTVVTPDCHHAFPEQREIQEFALLLNTHQKPLAGSTFTESLKYNDIMDRLDYLYGADRQMTFRNFAIYLLSGDEMREAMERQDIHRDEIYSNSTYIADGIEDYEIPEGLDLLPVEYADPDKTLRGYAIKALKEKGLTSQEYRDRLDEELSVIKDKGFAPYFLMVRNITNYAHQHDILMSPGRGSAAGSLVAYALGITAIDPIEHNLLFFRFIDASRDDMPDIDMDFMDIRREEVKKFIKRKYGEVASIATFMEFGDKNVIRDIARVLNIPLSDVNRMLQNVHSWDDYARSRNTVVASFREKYPEVLQYASQLHGRIRGSGVHAAGVVASKVPLADIAPIETRNAGTGERVEVVAVDKDEAERIGLIKMDILGLKTLTVVHDTLKSIKDRHGIEIDLNSLEDDPKVLNMLNDGLTKGVFQLEAGPYTSLVLNMHVHSFDELVASNALVRPGAANTIGREYIARKNGLNRTTYIHELMKPYVEDTYGCILYQEQVMQACVILGGMTMAEANKVRKIIGKKKDAAEFDQFKEKFVSGAEKYVGRSEAEALWHDFEAHAGYSFNKSHAVAYSTVSYWTAWLKYHYPVEFFHALLSNEKNIDSITDYLIEARRMGIRIKLPHVNLSDINWSYEGNALRFGLSNIKYISDTSAKRFIDARPFESYNQLEEFVFTKGSGVNSRALKALSDVGAANFEDHKVGKDEALSNAYEYLGLPSFNVEIPAEWRRKMKNAVDYSDGDTAILHGYIRSVKTGATWRLFEAVDQTGTFAFFAKPKFDIEVGKSYILLISNKDVIALVDVDDLDGKSGIEKYLDSYPDDGFVVAASSRVTKAGQKMGTIVIHSENDLVPATLFASNFGSLAPRIKVGNVYEFDLKPSKTGDMVVSGMK